MLKGINFCTNTNVCVDISINVQISMDMNFLNTISSSRTVGHGIHSRISMTYSMNTNIHEYLYWCSFRIE